MGPRVRLSEIKHVLSLLQVFHVYAENVHSLSKNTGLPTRLDIFLSLFLALRVFSLCLDEFPPRRWTKFPQRDRNSPESHTSVEECVFHIHEINTGSCVVY